MSEMIERGAEALHALSRWSDVPWDQLQTQEKDRLLRESRAVIEAMREPTEDMINACDINIPTTGMITGVWGDMIDAILETQDE